MASTTSLRAFHEVGLAFHKRLVSLPARPASSGRRKAFSPNSRTKLPSTARGRRLAWQCSPWVSPPRKADLGQPFGRGAAISLQSTAAKGSARPTGCKNPLTKSSGGNCICRIGLVAQQIAHSVVVLAMRQAAGVAASCAAFLPLRHSSKLPIAQRRRSAPRPDKLSPDDRNPGFQHRSLPGCPGLIRSPPVCGIRAVGFRSKSDPSGFCRSTKTTSEFPKAAILSASASASGKCSRVADATPSVLWQARQLAFSRIGKRVVRKSPLCPQRVPPAKTNKIVRLSTKVSIAPWWDANVEPFETVTEPRPAGSDTTSALVPRSVVALLRNPRKRSTARVSSWCVWWRAPRALRFLPVAAQFFMHGHSASALAVFFSRTPHPCRITGECDSSLRHFLFFAVAAPAATEREVAEWVLRWEGSLILEGSNEPIRDLSFNCLPATSTLPLSTSSAAVMHPVELRELEGLKHLRQLYLPGKIWNPGGVTKTKPVCLKRSPH
jgi:hypothetical protein